MSGFLARLLDRTIEDGPVLRARPQALFERPRGGPPGALGAGPAWPGESHAFTQPPGRRARAGTVGKRLAQRPGTRDTGSQPGERDAPRAAPIALPRTPPVPSPASPQETDLARPSAPRLVAQPGAGDEAPPATRRRRRITSAQDGGAPAADAGKPDQTHEPREPAPPPPAIARSIAPSPRVTATLTPSPRPPASTAARGGAGEPPAAAPAPAPAPRGDRRRPQRLITQRRVAVARATDDARAAARTRLMRTGPQAPPTVHVTIGRLEVRASSPPAAPRPRAVAPQAPKLGLDEYLRARSGGAR
jgi:hypothetical protein